MSLYDDVTGENIPANTYDELLNISMSRLIRYSFTLPQMEDIFQEAVLRFRSKIAPNRSDREARTFFRKILRGIAIDLIRKQSRSPEVTLNDEISWGNPWPRIELQLEPFFKCVRELLCNRIPVGIGAVIEAEELTILHLMFNEKLKISELARKLGQKDHLARKKIRALFSKLRSLADFYGYSR